MSEFFEYYPQIEYCDELSTNLLVRSRIRNMVLENAVIFHPYVLTEGDRPDIVSHKYYGNSNYVWLLFYANDIFDPHFDWPLDSRDFEKFLHRKYPQTVFAKNSPNVSFNAATNTIESVHPATAASLNKVTKNFLQLKLSQTDNEDNDGYFTILRKEYNPDVGSIKLHVFEELVTQTANQNGALPTVEYTDPRISIHHYEDALGCYIDIFEYVGLAEEVTLSLSVPTGTFQVGESIVGLTSGASAVVVGQNDAGTFVEANGLTGAFQPGETIQGVTSSTTVNITSSTTGKGRRAVTVADYETNVNEDKRTISIIDEAYVSDILSELRDIF